MSRALQLLTLAEAGAFFFLMIAAMMGFISSDNTLAVFLCVVGAFIVPNILAVRDQRKTEEVANG